MLKHLKKFKSKPLSWSSISSWKWNKDQWARKYLEGIIDPPNKQMEFGKKVGELLATVPDFLLEVPRYTIFEKELRVQFGSIPLVGYLDSFQEKPLAFIEFKTHTKKDKWTQKTCDDHGQLMMYLALLWITYKITPEKISCHLVAIPVTEGSDFKMKLVKESPKIFEVKKKKIDVLNFLIEVKNIYKEMCEYALQYK